MTNTVLCIASWHMAVLHEIITIQGGLHPNKTFLRYISGELGELSKHEGLEIFSSPIYPFLWLESLDSGRGLRMYKGEAGILQP